MKTDLPFNSLEDRPLVTVQFDGRALQLPDGANLAASLLAAGFVSFRQTHTSGAPRGPFCMMGACFDCLVQIDDIVQQACQCEVEAGMVISRPDVDREKDDA